MSYENLVPTVEAEHILREREKTLIFAQHCTREFTGEVKQQGDQVTITVEGHPTIYILEKNGTYTASGTDANGTAMSGNIAGKGKDVAQGGIPDAEAMPFAEILLQVNKIALFNVEVGDIDQRLASKKDLMGTIRRAIGKQLANQEDLAVARTIFNYSDSAVPTALYAQTTEVITTADTGTNLINVLDLVDKVVEEFNNRDVGDEEKIVCECSPKFWRYLKKALRETNTDNSALLLKRKCTEYNGIYFFKSNNTKLKLVSTDTSKTECISFRTLKAVAFFDPYLHIEPYRIQAGFKDCLKGFQLFDCGIIKPKEVIWFKPKWA